MEIRRSDVALIYNDRSVLENHHVSAAFRLMRIDDYNILSEFSTDEFKFVRFHFQFRILTVKNQTFRLEIFDIWSSKWFWQRIWVVILLN